MTSVPRAYYNGRLRLSSDATTTATDWYPIIDCTHRSKPEPREVKLRPIKLIDPKIDRIARQAEAKQRFQKGKGRHG
jgi:hypothetical protein